MTVWIIRHSHWTSVLIKSTRALSNYVMTKPPLIKIFETATLNFPFFNLSCASRSIIEIKGEWKYIKRPSKLRPKTLLFEELIKSSGAFRADQRMKNLLGAAGYRLYWNMLPAYRFKVYHHDVATTKWRTSSIKARIKSAITLGKSL